MRYENTSLQDRLAADYVLGNLRGPARSRLFALMRRYAGLRARVALWEERLFPWVMRAPPIKPPARVWRAIHARIAPRSAARFSSLAAWARLMAGGFAAAAMAALLFFVVTPAPPAFTMVAVLNDTQAQPGILVSWTPQQAAAGQLAVRIVAHPSMPAGTSWQAWLLADTGAPPRSLGFISAELTQTLQVPPDVARALAGAAGIGVSVEAKDGSASGQPTGAYLFQGRVLRVDS